MLKCWKQGKMKKRKEKTPCSLFRLFLLLLLLLAAALSLLLLAFLLLLLLAFLLLFLLATALPLLLLLLLLLLRRGRGGVPRSVVSSGAVGGGDCAVSVAVLRRLRLPARLRTVGGQRPALELPEPGLDLRGSFYCLIESLFEYMGAVSKVL